MNYYNAERQSTFGEVNDIDNFIVGDDEVEFEDPGSGSSDSDEEEKRRKEKVGF